MLHIENEIMQKQRQHRFFMFAYFVCSLAAQHRLLTTTAAAAALALPSLVHFAAVALYDCCALLLFYTLWKEISTRYQITARPFEPDRQPYVHTFAVCKCACVLHICICFFFVFFRLLFLLLWLFLFICLIFIVCPFFRVGLLFSLRHDYWSSFLLRYCLYFFPFCILL